jgi:uncharacterized protein (DUF4415 family)
MKKSKARAVLIDGKAYQRKADGTLVPLESKTDWKRLDRQTSARTESIADNDSEGAPMSDAEWARAEIVRPEKVAVGIKLDDDMLGWFKSQGKGYQTRINTVLRRFYEAHHKSGSTLASGSRRDVRPDALRGKSSGSLNMAGKRK